MGSTACRCRRRRSATDDDAGGSNRLHNATWHYPMQVEADAPAAPELPKADEHLAALEAPVVEDVSAPDDVHDAACAVTIHSSSTSISKLYRGS